MRDELRSQFPHRPWLDVRSKADLPLAEGIEPSMVPPGTLEVSVLEGTHVEELKERMTSLAVEEGQALADQEAMQEAAGQGQAQGQVEAPGPIVI